jgi:hypothetical protein
MPRGGISINAIGTPIARVNAFIFIISRVSPNAEKKFHKLRLPKTANKFPTIVKARKVGALDHLAPYNAPMSEPDKVIKAMVAGTKNRAPYFTEAAKIVLRSRFSLSEFSFEKAGNKTVPMGTEKKLSKMAKFVATL